MRQQMKGLTKISFISSLRQLSSTLLILLLFAVSSFGQTNQKEYLESNPNKKEFSKDQWKQIKGKMKQESSGSGASSSDGDFSAGDFTPEEAAEESSYDYDPEEYKGEFSEYQDLEDAENYEDYDDSYDNYDAQDNYYYEKKEHDDGSYNQYQKPKDKEIKKPKPIKPSSSDLSTGQTGFGFLSYLGLFLAIGVIIYLVYYFFLRYQEDGSGAKVVMNFEDTPPSEIPKTELERRLEEALAKGNFREAVRIYFIFIVKDLSEKKWINWERKKTNFSYLMEMRGKPQFDLFNETVSIYEVVWYGNYTIDESTYKQVEPKFKKMLTDIQ